MASHVIAFTAEFKIDAVRKGDCTQTIRQERKRPINVGDSLLLHGWEGLPYRSKWNWRLNAICTEVIPIKIQKIEMDILQDYLITFEGEINHEEPWDRVYTLGQVEDLALDDGFKDDVIGGQSGCCGYEVMWQPHCEDEWMMCTECKNVWKPQTASEKMFEYFDKSYKLSTPKEFSVIRWRLI